MWLIKAAEGRSFKIVITFVGKGGLAIEGRSFKTAVTFVEGAVTFIGGAVTSIGKGSLAIGRLFKITRAKLYCY